MLFILLVTFSLVAEFFDAATAPFLMIEDIKADDDIAVDHPDDINTDIPQDDSISAGISPGIPFSDGFITVRMDPLDVFRGNLILINNDHIYEIPETQDFVNINEYKTASYQVTDDDHFICSTVIEPLNEMMDNFFDETGVDSIVVISTFRDHERQQAVLDDYIARFGRRGAALWAAQPGYSEHHTGLAVDFGVYSNRSLRTFQGTGTTAWFAQNSYRFGFILRFPEDKVEITGTNYEPWHFRYIGLPHSYFMFMNNLCLEEYIELITEHTAADPFKAVRDGVPYEIYFVPSIDIPIPLDSDFDISGNNIGGFIVTITRAAS